MQWTNRVCSFQEENNNGTIMYQTPNKLTIRLMIQTRGASLYSIIIIMHYIIINSNMNVILTSVSEMVRNSSVFFVSKRATLVLYINWRCNVNGSSAKKKNFTLSQGQLLERWISLTANWNTNCSRSIVSMLQQFLRALLRYLPFNARYQTTA